MMEKIKINEGQCLKAADVLKNYTFRASFYERDFLATVVDKEIKLRAYLFATAICHQTHSLQNKILNLKGWDFLEQVFLQLMENNSECLEPQFLTFITKNDLIQKMKTIFAEDGNPVHCTLDRLPERAELLKQTARMIYEEYNGRVQNLLEKSGYYLLKNGQGIYELLENFSAFSDPLRKKSTLFIKLLDDAKLISVKDPENFTPTMDYQIQRVLLRMGCVEIIDQSLKENLKERRKIDSDIEIREGCIGAVQMISRFAGYQLTRLSDLLWALGRSCCNEKMLCRDKMCNRTPCSLCGLINIKKHDHCIFQNICSASTKEEYRKFWQPVVRTQYY